MTHLYNGIGVQAEPALDAEGLDGLDLAVTFADAGRAVRSAVEVDLHRLPSRCEIFFISADLPHGKYRTTKAKAMLGWEPRDSLEKYFRKSAKSKL
jgi:nucleoside-diphosphate-sugar epimerase